MNYAQLKRIEEICSTYRWEPDGSLSVWINYRDCRELIVDLLKIDGEIAPKNCVALDELYIPKFENILAYCIDMEDIESMFQKEDH